MKGKIKWIMIAVIVVILLIVATIITINELGLQYQIEEIKEYNYFVLTKEGKYGVIDKSGNVVIEPQYMIVQIPNPSKPIFICVNSYNQETKDYETTVYNEKNEVILKEYQNIQAISIDTNVETVPYEKSVVTYQKDGKYGLLTLEGKQITKPIYEKISSIDYKEGTFLVTKDGKHGVINMKGKVIIDNKY